MHTTHEGCGPTRKDNPGTRIWEDMRKQGLKQTAQRRVILEVFLDMGGHPSTEELHEEILRRGHNLGLATTYRTLKMLVETDFARKVEFGDGFARYELRGGDGQHLHMVCERCGKTFEAPAQAVDRLFKELARGHAFALRSHSTCLYGLCDECIAKTTKKNTGEKDTP